MLMPSRHLERVFAVYLSVILVLFITTTSLPATCTATSIETTTIRPQDIPTSSTTTVLPPTPESITHETPTAQSDSGVAEDLNYENYLSASSATTPAAVEELASDKELTRATERLVSEAPSQALENRIGLSALIDAPPPEAVAARDGVPTTARPLMATSTSSYLSSGGDDEDQDDDLRKVGPQVQVGVEVTTLQPPVANSTATSELAPVISNAISNINDDDHHHQQQQLHLDDLQALASNTSSESLASSANKSRVHQPNSWTRPLSQTYFVPQTTSGPEPPAQQAAPAVPAFERDFTSRGSSSKLKPPLEETIIPHTSVTDLLHIIKHLNLINTDHDHGDHGEADRAQRLAKSSQPQQIQLIGLQPKLLPAKRRPVLLSGDMAALESSSILGKTTSTTSLGGDLQTTSRPTAPENVGSTRRPPTNYTLISPYSANFESAIPLLKNVPINRASVSSLRDQIQASVAEKHDEVMVHHGVSKSHNNKSHHHQQTIKIGSKPGRQTNTRQSGQSPSSSSSSTRHRVKEGGGEPSGGGAPPTRTNSKPAKSRVRLAARPHTLSDSDEPSGSKRGERDAANKTVEAQKQPAENSNNSSDMKKQIGPSDHHQRANQTNEMRASNQSGGAGGGGGDHSGLASGAPHQVNSAQAYSHAHAASPALVDPMILHSLRQRLAEAALAPVPSTLSSYLDDPHKKSYYWASEQANIYDQQQHQRLPRPLTIGELARQHGIMNDLKFISQAPSVPPLEDYGLFSESGLHEQLAPFTNSDGAVPTVVAPPPPLATSTTDNKPLPVSKIKLDDELKQRIAIKAFEAAARDPDLSAALFGSLLGPKSGGQNFNFVPQQFNQSPAPSPVMTPLPSMQDSAQVLHPGAHQAPLSQPAVNLVVADLANKWALSRMPDLVPIPLAATVPGYLIRLPNGKILAAALTNMFSIQGIQREPTTTSTTGGGYKNIMNQKFKGLMSSGSSSSRPLGQQQVGQKQPMNPNFAGLVADSGLRPTLALPSGLPAYSLMGTKGQRGHHHHNQLAHKLQQHQHQQQQQHNQSKDKGGLFSSTRNVLGQLSLLASSSRAHHQRHLNNQAKIKQKHENENKMRANKLSKAKMVELIKSLPIADPNEPVFSFADESELIDDYHTAASNVNQHPGSGNGQSAVPLYSTTTDGIVDNQGGPSPPLLVGQESQMTLLGDGPHHTQHLNNEMQPNQMQSEIFEGTSNLLLPLKDRLNHLINLRNSATLASDDIFGYNKRKRKSPQRLSLAKLEPLLNWIKSKRAGDNINRRDSRVCNDKS